MKNLIIEVEANNAVLEVTKSKLEESKAENRDYRQQLINSMFDKKPESECMEKDMVVSETQQQCELVIKHHQK